MVKMLIEKGANPGPQDDQGLTPLHFQETLKSNEVTEYLVQHGAPIDLPTKVNKLPVQLIHIVILKFQIFVV